VTTRIIYFLATMLVVSVAPMGLSAQSDRSPTHCSQRWIQKCRQHENSCLNFSFCKQWPGSCNESCCISYLSCLGIHGCSTRHMTCD
jgi:hypothetical protein